MNQHNSDNLSVNPEWPVLLVGDDGKMHSLLSQQGHTCCGPSGFDALKAILLFSKSDFRAVMINVDYSQNQTINICSAFKRLKPDRPVLTYGNGYSEVFVKQALMNKKADEFLPWPIPANQLVSLFGKPNDFTQIPVNKEDTISSNNDSLVIDNGLGNIVGEFLPLANLVTAGPDAVIQKAQELLMQVFDLKEVMVSHDRGQYCEFSFSTDITGPCGIVGKLWINHDISVENCDKIQEAGDLIATMIYLAKRDQALKYLSVIDELTGAYNRRYLEYFMRNLIKNNHKDQTNMTLLIFDLDEFKYFNDNYGHSAGDEVLKQTTKLMKMCCRKHDIVCRLGGDEFAVLFWDAAARKAYSGEKCVANTENVDADVHSRIVTGVAQRFLKMLNMSEFPSLGPEAKGKLTVSGGLAKYPQDGKDLETLLEQADNALLSAKRHGKNQIYLVGVPAVEDH
ncbi:MAG: GGDEF domain-containing protein [Phycisphaerae bacterium]|nr:GGDEF domain-containing protein [Phycisphaerae bacterium]